MPSQPGFEAATAAESTGIAPSPLQREVPAGSGAKPGRAERPSEERDEGALGTAAGLQAPAGSPDPNQTSDCYRLATPLRQLF